MATTDAVNGRATAGAAVYSLAELAAVASGELAFDETRVAATLAALVALAKQQPAILQSTLAALIADDQQRQR